MGSLPFPGVRNKDAVIFPRRVSGHYVMFHCIHPDICGAYSKNLKRLYDLSSVMGPRPKMWDCFKIEAAGPPIEVDEGWLLLYHGVDDSRVYRLGATLLDSHDPEKVIYRSEEPILEPIEDYERLATSPTSFSAAGRCSSTAGFSSTTAVRTLSSASRHSK